MKRFKGSEYSYEVLYRPGNDLTDDELADLHREILKVARSCLDEIPQYQCLTGSKQEFQRIVLAIARDRENQMVGFCSAYLLKAGEQGEVLHLGLTCVSPTTRGGGLTHQLTSRVVMAQLRRSSWWRPIWISNVACVLSSLGNVGLYFEDVYPSPFLGQPSREHLALANVINERYRWELFIDPSATFDEKQFVFRASVKGNMFQKAEEDRRFRHREDWLNEFYGELMDFENGDEVLQIGRISWFAYPKHALRSLKRKILAQEAQGQLAVN